MDRSTLNPRDLGAAGDGEHDDTGAVQKALDEAAERKSAVFLPPGTYLCSTLRLHPRVALAGVPAWSYRSPGGSILKLGDEKAKCLLDITGAFGTTIEGLSLEGGRLGEGVHGIHLDKADYGEEEDAFRIERCRVSHFSGDGLRADRAWCFSVRHCMISHNGGNGVRLRGWDVFLVDNWLSGNGEAGFGAYEENAAVTLTGNRIEWNRAGGVLVRGGSHYNVTGNYIDRCGASGVALLPRDGHPCRHVAVTGNVVYRSGKWAEAASHESSHIRLDGARGVTVVGNTMTVGRDDRGQGEWTPSFGIVYGGLDECVIKDNVLHGGALKELLVDLGGNGPAFVVKDNPGSLFQPES